MELLKRCSKCNQYYPLNYFHKLSRTKSGYNSNCKYCINSERHKYYNKHKDILRVQSLKYSNSLRGRFASYKAHSKNRGIKFQLSFIEFCELISQPCTYCGELQENFNGIDRIDSNANYSLSNCVPCCSTCNYMKQSQSKEEFIMKCKLITEKQEVMYNGK